MPSWSRRGFLGSGREGDRGVVRHDSQRFAQLRYHTCWQPIFSATAIQLIGSFSTYLLLPVDSLHKAVMPLFLANPDYAPHAPECTEKEDCPAHPLTHLIHPQVRGTAPPTLLAFA